MAKLKKVVRYEHRDEAHPERDCVVYARRLNIIEMSRLAGVKERIKASNMTIPQDGYGLLAETLADAVFKWEGVEDEEGSEAECSRENVLALLLDPEYVGLTVGLFVEMSGARRLGGEDRGEGSGDGSSSGSRTEPSHVTM